MILPKFDRLVIPTEKFTKYVLDPVHQKDKALAFKLALGFTIADTEILIEKIRLGVSVFTAEKKSVCEWGERYQVIIRMNGRNGKIANILTGWIDDNKTGEMRLTSAYITKREVSINDRNKTV